MSYVPCICVGLRVSETQSQPIDWIVITKRMIKIMMWNGNNATRTTITNKERLSHRTPQPQTPSLHSFPLSLELIAEHSEHEPSIHHLFRLIVCNNIHDNTRRQLARHARIKSCFSRTE